MKIYESPPNTTHIDPRRRHFGRASAEVAGRRFETEGRVAELGARTCVQRHTARNDS
jgi:hypothetical protein